MTRRLTLCILLTLLTGFGLPNLAAAQGGPDDGPETTDTPQGPPGEVPPARTGEPPVTTPTPGEELPEEGTSGDGEEEEEAPTEAPTEPVETPEEPAFEPVETPEEPAFEPAETGSESPISGLGGDEDFVPLEDIEEEALDPIFPAQVYPYVDWAGQFRFRQRLGTRFDLGTGGTSAILPPTESYTPVGNPADADANKLWGADIKMRLEPTLSITEGVRLHIEADLLPNQVLGALPVNGLPPNPIRPDPSRNQASSAQFSAREREWFTSALRVNEAYGELTGFFGTVRAGRMDNDWGLGMFYNGGDCMDCDWGDSIDRLYLESQFRGIHGSLAVDWPGEGITSNNPNSPLGQPYDRSQIDDIDQYTLTLFYAPTTLQERERQENRLNKERKPVLNGGALFSWRSQEGTFADPFTDPALSVATNPLVYRGMNMYVGDAWARFLYNPNADTRIRIELEAMGIFGSLDNATFSPVGQAEDEEEMAAEINCFDEGARSDNSARCNVNQKSFNQFGLALESEFSVGGPVDFGANAGFASGGRSPNWGFGAQDQISGGDLDFFRFDPDYHVDLILFRNVIGTVTNAYYVNPYLKATFLDRGDRKLRFDLDAIVSRAARVEGTPSGESPWLGVELDGALRFFLKNNFHAALEGGLLLPFNGLAATLDRERLTQFGNNAPTFSQTVDPSTAWTVQFKLNWQF